MAERRTQKRPVHRNRSSVPRPVQLSPLRTFVHGRQRPAAMLDSCSVLPN